MLPISDPTDWVHSIVIASKPNGGLRICMDPRKLNVYIKREHYPLPTIENAFTELHGARYFTVLDASTAFLQVPLDEESSQLCTIATIFGRYRYKTMPYGINSAPEVFQKIVNQMLDGVTGIVPYIDDILVYGSTLEEHNNRLRAVLDRARKYNLHFSKSKLQLAKSHVKFLGHNISRDGVQVDNRKVEAVKIMKSPNNKQELQRFLGVVTYLGKFIPNLSQETAVLRKLISKNADFKWEEDEEKAFLELKKLITTAPVLRFYDPKQPLCISVDASSYGLGAVALQKDRPVAYCSTSLNDTQRKYAQIEKEMLAVLHGLERFHLYAYGRKVRIQTDHKPLLSIVKKPIEAVSPRLQRMVLKLLRYDYELEFVPGKNLCIADALSRDPNSSNDIATQYLEGQAAAIHTVVCATTRRVEELRQAIQSDETSKHIIHFADHGWPSHKYLIKGEAKKYWDVKEELHYADGLLFRGNRIFIPQSERLNVLQKLHRSHQGVNSCQNRAKSALYWPGMFQDIENHVLNCQTCQRYSKSNTKQPLISHEIPKLPWNKIAIDFAKIKNQTYAIITDYFSKFAIVKAMTTTNAPAVIAALEETISTHGIPLTIMSDNGPPFDSREYCKFLEQYDIKPITSSPHYPKSNGMVERAVQTVKGLIIKTGNTGGNMTKAILDYNCTPKYNLPSPAELLMGRRLRNNPLITEALLIPKYDISVTSEVLSKKQAKQKEYHDLQSERLPELEAEQDILVQKGLRNWVPGKVIEKCQEPESYMITTQEGGTYRRNRLHLRPLRTTTNEAVPSPPQEKETISEVPNILKDTSNNTSDAVIKSTEVRDEPKPYNSSAKAEPKINPEPQELNISVSGTPKKSPSDALRPITPVFSRPARATRKPKYLSDYKLF